MIISLGLLGPIGCATAPPESDVEAREAYEASNDPLEPFNRAMFAFNVEADRFVLKPVAFVYKEAVPDPFQDMIRNFLHNLTTPVILVNDILQGEFSRATDTFARFLMNSGFGLAGTLDIASEFGVEKHDEDFGQTLGVWGAGEGPYLMLPFLGPSNPRDLIGFVVDFFTDPLLYFRFEKFGYSRFGAKIVDRRARNYDLVNDLERTSVDYYATVRSLYRQTRNDEIRNGAAAPMQPLPTISFDWGAFTGIQEARTLTPVE